MRNIYAVAFVFMTYATSATSGEIVHSDDPNIPEFDNSVKSGRLLKGGTISLFYNDIRYQPDHVDIGNPNQGAIGGSLKYALPLSENTRIQFDLLGDLNVTGSKPDADFLPNTIIENDLTHSEYMAALHLNYSDLSQYTVGLFAGAGKSFDSGDDDDGPIPFWFGGVEAEYYIDDFTIGAQIGLLDSKDFWLESIYDAKFARIYANYYLSDNTKFVGELSYLKGDRPNGDPDGGGVIDIAGWGLGISHALNDSGLSVAIMYNHFDYTSAVESDEPWVNEITFSLTYLFGAKTMRENDRYAAGASLPKIHRWISTAANEIQ